jgi:hypothetical protein
VSENGSAHLLCQRLAKGFLPFVCCYLALLAADVQKLTSDLVKRVIQDKTKRRHNKGIFPSGVYIPIVILHPVRQALHLRRIPGF